MSQTVEGQFIQVDAVGNVAPGRRDDAFKMSLTVRLFTSEYEDEERGGGKDAILVLTLSQ